MDEVEDTPAQKWWLIGSTSLMGGSADGRARRDRVYAALRTVYGLPPDADRDAIIAAGREYPLTGDERAVKLLAAYGALLDDTAMPVDRIALPYTQQAQGVDDGIER